MYKITKKHLIMLTAMLGILLSFTAENANAQSGSIVITGQVTDLVTGQPIAGARINNSSTIVTDSNGYYQLTTGSLTGSIFSSKPVTLLAIVNTILTGRRLMSLMSRCDRADRAALLCKEQCATL